MRALGGAPLVQKGLKQTVVVQTSQTGRLFSFQMAGASHSIRKRWSVEYFAIIALPS